MFAMQCSRPCNAEWGEERGAAGGQGHSLPAHGPALSTCDVQPDRPASLTIDTNAASGSHTPMAFPAKSRAMLPLQGWQERCQSECRMVMAGGSGTEGPLECCALTCNSHLQRGNATTPNSLPHGQAHKPVSKDTCGQQGQEGGMLLAAHQPPSGMQCMPPSAHLEAAQLPSRMLPCAAAPRQGRSSKHGHPPCQSLWLGGRHAIEPARCTISWPYRNKPKLAMHCLHTSPTSASSMRKSPRPEWNTSPPFISPTCTEGASGAGGVGSGTSGRWVCRTGDSCTLNRLPWAWLAGPGPASAALPGIFLHDAHQQQRAQQVAEVGDHQHAQPAVQPKAACMGRRGGGAWTHGRVANGCAAACMPAATL